MANLEKTEIAITSRINQLNSQVAVLSEQIKSLGKEKDILIASKKLELADLDKKLSDRSLHVSGMEQNAADLDKRIFENELKKATSNAELKTLEADIEAARKYVEYVMALAAERENALASLEKIIGERNSEITRLDGTIVQRRKILMDIEARHESVLRELGPLEEYLLWRKGEKEKIEAEKSGIQDEREKSGFVLQ